MVIDFNDKFDCIYFLKKDAPANNLIIEESKQEETKESVLPSFKRETRNQSLERNLAKMSMNTNKSNCVEE